MSQLTPVYGETLLRLLIYKKVEITEIRGIYAIYFGLLYFRDDYTGAWYILASMLNVHPGESTPYVLEGYFTILAEMLARHSKKRLQRIYNYLNRIYFRKMNNTPIEMRIKATIEKHL